MLNDSAGDPDGLAAVAHAVLSGSTQLVGLVGTHGGSEDAKLKHDKILELAGVTGVPSYVGAETALVDTSTPIESEGALALVEAAKNFTPPEGPEGVNRYMGFYPKLFVTVGGGLTDVASAILIDPTITQNITLVWIGGGEYSTNGSGETNAGMDVIAANVVFGSDVEIWQVPRNAYAQCFVSMTEMRRDLYPYGELGKWLFEAFRENYNGIFDQYGVFMNHGETWTLGDNPLVLLTALMAWHSTDTPSSTYHEEDAPLFTTTIDNSYGFPNAVVIYDKTTPNPNPRQIRVYDELDTRTMFADFFAKMQGKFPL
jgi:hypothetical protein